MYSPPHVVDMYIHPLRVKLDQGFSRPRIKMVRGVGDKIEASQGNKGATTKNSAAVHYRVPHLSNPCVLHPPLVHY